MDARCTRRTVTAAVTATAIVAAPATAAVALACLEAGASKLLPQNHSACRHAGAVTVPGPVMVILLWLLQA
eukprot:365350-Chlamydomonas_euryale.AAC.9